MALKEEIFDYFDPPLATLEISADAGVVEVNSNIEIKAVLHQIGGRAVRQGVVEFSADATHLAKVSGSQIKTDEFKGSTVVSGKTEFKALAAADTADVIATFSSGELQVKSNILSFKIAEPKAEEAPHLDSSDTNRVNLSGTWQIEVGGQMGIMTLKQATDSTLTGSFSIPDSNWPEGQVRGFKDGATIRIFLDFDTKARERLRVAGHFDIEGNNGYIQIKGCAYHLRKTPNARYTRKGKEGLDCDQPVNYDNWTRLAGLNFYASAPFSSKPKDKTLISKR